jgi:hypothetical protein
MYCLIFFKPPLSVEGLYNMLQMQVIYDFNEQCILLDFNHMWLNHDCLLTKYTIYIYQTLEAKTEWKSLHVSY